MDLTNILRFGPFFFMLYVPACDQLFFFQVYFEFWIKIFVFRNIWTWMNSIKIVYEDCFAPGLFVLPPPTRFISATFCHGIIQLFWEVFVCILTFYHKQSTLFVSACIDSYLFINSFLRNNVNISSFGVKNLSGKRKCLIQIHFSIWEISISLLKK